MNELNLDDLRKLCDSGNIKWTKHVIKRLQERQIEREAVYQAIFHDKII